MGNKDGLDRIREIRHLDERHHFTLMCRDFAQLGQFVTINNALFRSVKAATPGPYTFILPATREVPRRLLHPRKKTVGVRITEHAVAQALLAELGEPLVSSTPLLAGHEGRGGRTPAGAGAPASGAGAGRAAGLQHAAAAGPRGADDDGLGDQGGA